MRSTGRALFLFTLLGALAAAGTASAQYETSTVPQHPRPVPDRWVIIHAGALLADANQPPQHNVSIIVKNDKIQAIRAGFVEPKDVAGAPPTTVQVVDLSNKFVMPGFIDAHVHTGGDSMVAGIKNAREKVLAGATTVRDAGSAPEIIFPLRDAIAQGLVPGPRILASGAPVSTTGGHGDSRNGNFANSLREPTFASGICDGVDECRKVVRRQIQLGADQVKVIATAGVGDNSDTGLDQQFSDSELSAIVETAHLMKRKVMAHAIGTEGIKAAVRAGVDSIEHGDLLDDQGAEMMKARGVYLVPTLDAPNDVLRRIQNPYPGGRPISENTKHKMMRLPEAKPGGLGGQVRLALRHQLKIAVGTDFGGSPSDEMVLMVRYGGMSPAAAVRAVTLSNADLLGISDQVGTIAPGKSADIVGLDGSPLEDIGNATKVSFVMARGHEYKGPGVQLP